jgi:hypothetical protein
MKNLSFFTKNYVVWLIAMLFANFSFAQGFCTDFNNPSTTTSIGTGCTGVYTPSLLDNWGAQNIDGLQYRNTNSQGGTSDYYLHLDDGSCGNGGTIAFNDVDYSGNWLKFVSQEEGCFCFDLRSFYIQTGTINGYNSLRIYDGPDPGSSTLSAVFTLTTPIDVSQGWVRICAPVALSDGTNLPGNADGQWTINTGLASDWDTLIQNVGSLAFGVDVAGGDERWGIDNICISEVCDATVGGDPQPTDDGAYCCDGKNLVTNGNFEFGNTGFNSSYSNNSAVNPGEYNVTNSAAPFGATISDHSFCADPSMYAANDDYLLINGKTQQSGNSVIWEQTITGLRKGANYKFCANFKNMPQCTFDILPNINMGVVGIGSTGFSTINANPADPCDWINKEFNFTASGGTLTLRMILDETGNGDGNDLAIDDISVTQLIDPNLSITVQHQGNPQQITASINTISPSDDTLHGADCGYYWFAAEVTSFPPIVVSGPTFASGNTSGNSIGSSPWNLTTTFPDYNFNQNTLYVIGMYTPECECYDEGFTYQLTLNNRPVSEEMMTEEQKQLIIYWILNGYDGGTLGTSTDGSSGAQEMRLYPNPTQESFNVSLDGDTLKSVEIFSTTGQSIFAKSYSNGKKEETIDLSSFTSGVYFIKAYGDNGKQYNAKVLKE